MYLVCFSNGKHISRRSQRQRISPSPEPQFTTTINQLSPIELSHISQPSMITDVKPKSLHSTVSITSPPTIMNSNSLLDRSNITSNHLQTPNFVAQQKLGLSDSLNIASGDNDVNSSNLTRKKNLSTSDLDPFERRKQIALTKAEGKLEKAQQLYRIAQQSVEQNLSELLRVTTIPRIPHESETPNTAYEKRIRTIQETKEALETKIANYRADIARIQAGDIPARYTSSKDTQNNISNENSQHNSINNISTLPTNEQSIISHNLDADNHHHHHAQTNLSSTIIHHNNNQNLLSLNQNSNTLEPIRSSPSSSISNEIGNSQFYIDSNYDHVYDGDKLNRKHDAIIPADISVIHDTDKSPSTKRRLTDDSNIEFNDRISDHSSDDRFVSYNTSKRNTMATIEYHQLMLKIDSMQKIIDRSDTKMNELQKQIDVVIKDNLAERQRNSNLDRELADLTEIHQNEMSSMKKDLKNLEEKLLYNFNEYWTEMVEKLDKLDTRTTKVEQTQAISLETEENTHRLITKFVNILLTVFAIILLLLSTIKNLVQSRVHAVILLILVFTWISFHYLPENYFQSPFIKNFPHIFKRTT
ncbi:unnamed protein product [Adineta steineri]|uniref:Uncharacterized protein n=1 Tax=Adineta steineri TaxID=433720 RepID=A0A814E4X5_9BILA|nr:unnamed protein product [Adineta steineri]CAF0963090.1 unnamed protein product [Adineta steineri]